MKIPILALWAGFLLQPLACSHQTETHYGSDLFEEDDSSEGQAGSPPDVTSAKEGPHVGGTNISESTGGTTSSGGTNSTGGTTSTAGTAPTGHMGADNGGTSP